MRNITLDSNQRFPSLLENMAEGFALHEIICDQEGNPVDYRFLKVNRAFEKLTGLKEKDIKNCTVKAVLPNTENDWIKKCGEVALNNKSFACENYSPDLKKYFSVNIYSPTKYQFATVFSEISKQENPTEDIDWERDFFKTFLNNTSAGYWDWDIHNKKKYISASYKAMLGYSEKELPDSPDTWKTLIYEEDITKINEGLQQHVNTHGIMPFSNEVRYRHKNGFTIWVRVFGRVVDWDGDIPLRMIGGLIDISQQKELEEKFKSEHNLFKTTLYSLGDAVISADKDGKVDIMNVVAESLTGWTLDEAKGMAFETVFHIINEHTRRECDNPVKKVFETGKIIELANHTLLITKNGHEVPIEDSAAPIQDENGEITGVVLVFRDVTEKKQKQKKIEYISKHDQLTGLYNRHFFEEELTKFDTGFNLPLTIVMLDVNGLKLTNDAFGHHAGDLLLKSVAKMLTSNSRKQDVVARIGGDEFVLLLPNTTENQAVEITDAIYSAVKEEKMENIIISVSIGWETKANSTHNISEIFSKAEKHMYSKKLIESQSMRNQTIKAIMHTLKETNSREKIHSRKVSEISLLIGELLNLDSQLLKEVETAGFMHDIGKIAINSNILDKADKLTDEEYKEIKRHPEIGYHILKSVDEYTHLAEYVLSHHERWDGRGYPRGLSGEEIPFVARIIAVADAYEAMTGERPYKEYIDKMEAIKELRRCSGTQFDPKIVEVFTEYIKDQDYSSVNSATLACRFK